METIKGVYFYLRKIYDLIHKYNKNFEMVVFDSILKEDRSVLHGNTILFEMRPSGNWNMLLDQILQNDRIIRFLSEK